MGVRAMAGRPGTTGWLWAWSVFNKKGNDYTVSIKELAGAVEWGCSCPASRFKTDGARTYKHVLELQVAILTHGNAMDMIPERIRYLIMPSYVAERHKANPPAPIAALIHKVNERKLKVIQ